jgi:phosphate transport system substrate-binding protein
MLNACDERKETTTKGNLAVYVDESLYNVVTASVDTFMRLYPDAKITVQSLQAKEGIAKVLNNEAEIFVSGRNLNKEEKDFVSVNSIEMKTLKYCYDGVALIHSDDLNLTNVSYDSLMSFLTGRSSPKVFLPSNNSSTYEYLKTEIIRSGDPYFTELVEKEIDIVQNIDKEKSSIGFIGVNCLYKMNVLKSRLGAKSQGGQSNVYYEAHPGFLVQSLYPMTRQCVIFLREINNGLASGFATFLTATEGQKIVLEQRLGPATVPVRISQ